MHGDAIRRMIHYVPYRAETQGDKAGGGAAACQALYAATRAAVDAHAVCFPWRKYRLCRSVVRAQTQCPEQLPLV